MQPAIVPSRRVEPVSRLTSDLDIDGCMYMKNVRDKLAPRRGQSSTVMQSPCIGRV